MAEAREEILRKFSRNRELAHAVLFGHRHPNRTPDFHGEMIRYWHGITKDLLLMAFRGGAKSTIAEEAILLECAFRECSNYVIAGSVQDRAKERLHAIKKEIDTNEPLADLFGDLHGPLWTDEKVILSNGVMIQTLGRGQALRGIKHEDTRPDRVFADDLEEKEDVRTPEARKRVLDWFLTDLLPACDTEARCRVAATPLHPEALPLVLSKPGTGFLAKKYPIEYLDEQGARQPIWGDRFPLWRIDKIKGRFSAAGMMREFRMEYMCEAESPEDKPFKSEMFRIEPVVRSWQAIYSMKDPARTTNPDSAMTGSATWSWVNNRLVVWDSWGELLMPDQIIQRLFEEQDVYHPVYQGVEEDGLNQWLMQPIRHEQVRRGIILPVKAEKAPRGKNDFIRGLFPFFNAREIVFAKPMPELEAQLKSFPQGRIDVPNALAYALKMRPGLPLYDDFGAANVEEGIEIKRGRKLWLVIGATPALTIAALAQYADGALLIYRDWIREGEPSSVLADLIREVQLDFPGDLELVGVPQHFERYNNVGLVQAARKVPVPMRQGLAPERGRFELQDMLKRLTKGLPAVRVAPQAIWTLNGFAGGYCRSIDKSGVIRDHAEEGPYRVLLEAIESFTGLLRLRSPEEDQTGINYKFTDDGRKYISALKSR